MIFETKMNDRKKEILAQYPDRKLASLAVAPTNTEKYFNAILCFYKIQIQENKSTNDGYYSDVLVYGRPRDEALDFQFLGHFSEVYQQSSTFISMLNPGELHILNAVINEVVKIKCSCSSMSSNITRSILHHMGPEIFKKKVDFEKMSLALRSYEKVDDKWNGLIIVAKDGLEGLVNLKTYQEIFPPVFYSIFKNTNGFKIDSSIVKIYISEDSEPIFVSAEALKNGMFKKENFIKYFFE